MLALTPPVTAISAAAQPSETAAWLEAYRQPASRLIGAALAGHAAWRRLADLTDTVGNRLSGSERLDRAIAWAVANLKKDGLENVHTEPVMVPHWVRGHEEAAIVAPAPHHLAMLGLGGSIATPPAGLEAEAIVVRNFGELDARAGQVDGRIVVFNEPYEGYGQTVQYRVDGASRAARHGAVAVLVRSVGLAGLRTPHTGYLTYAADAPKIPAAAIAAEDADRLQRMQDRGEHLVVQLKMEARMLPDVPSANVVAELRGRERPEEIVVVSGHLDSWDVGDGASDDGGGCIVTWEALRLMNELGLRPRRTVRLVLWTNEENGTRGGLAYREQHRQELAHHVLMLESDSGVFAPRGVGFTGSDRSRRVVQEIASLLRGIGADEVGIRGGGADVDPSADAAGIPTMSLDVDDSRYFLIHHTEADTIDKIDPSDMARCVAVVAVMAYVVADMPGRLER
ncbi:MAG: M20/M25/M40 family metallo-hydrolase [Acidobacteriota bacterium]|nr:M20/M25/M40 family metallo-hydrolase [Acidobacteriota bacterium]